MLAKVDELIFPYTVVPHTFPHLPEAHCTQGPTDRETIYGFLDNPLAMIPLAQSRGGMRLFGSRRGQLRRVPERIKPSGMVMVRRQQLQDTKPRQHLGHDWLHPYEHQMLVMGLGHANHVLHRWKIAVQIQSTLRPKCFCQCCLPAAPNATQPND